MENYTLLEEGRQRAWVLSREADLLGPALLRGEGTTSLGTGGRGEIARLPLAEGECIIRAYRRGGLAALFLRDQFLFHNRMLAEFRLTLGLHQDGAAVPEPLGVVWESRVGRYRGAIATRRLPGQTLLEHLRSTAAPEVLRLTGRRFRELHDLGLWHADLQVKNVITDGRDVWVIDFDNARRGRPVSALGRCRNLLRFRRSLEKNGLSLDNFDQILQGYGDLGISPWLSALYRIRGTVSDFVQK